MAAACAIFIAYIRLYSICELGVSPLPPQPEGCSYKNRHLKANQY
jgi:hypothetical protein